MSRASSPPRLRDAAVAALALAAAADALLFERIGGAVGLAAPLLAVLLALAVAACHRRGLARPPRPLALLLVALALAALVEHVDGRSLALALLCLAAFALTAARRLPGGLAAPAALARFVATLPLALPAAVLRRHSVRRRAARHGGDTPGAAWAGLAWIMPVALACGFVLLLSAGNPIIERWLAALDPLRLDPARALFWLAAAALAFAFLRPRPDPFGRSARSGPDWRTAAGDRPAPPAWRHRVFGPGAILRALVLFNAVFALQTGLDAAYLWGGMALPDGLSHAAYAHRGAYTLMAAALLAAAFVLLAMRPGSAASADRRIRGLVHLWIAQTILLVLSAMLRLGLYVDAYALTHLRLAAFVWMAVVAAGLGLICVRIAGRRSDRWLVGANLAVVALVFAGSCFIDDDALIARFNVAHSREISGEGASLDLGHLASLGPAAIPAIDAALAHAATLDDLDLGPRAPLSRALGRLRFELAGLHGARPRDWRAWTFRDWRLSRYLESHPAPAAPQLMGPALPPSEGPV